MRHAARTSDTASLFLISGGKHQVYDHRSANTGIPQTRGRTINHTTCLYDINQLQIYTAIDIYVFIKAVKSTNSTKPQRATIHSESLLSRGNPRGHAEERQ